jgi:hypothetical protein
MKSFFLLLALCASAFAQSEQARLVGTVTDATGALMSRVSVTVVNTKTGAQREATSNDDGLYVIPNLASSTYDVKAKAAGFADAEIKEFQLSVGQERTLNISMQPGTVTTEITVTGELTEMQTSSAAIGTNVNAREVASLPLNGRQLSQLYLLTPGAQTAGGGSYDNIRFSGRANQQNAIRFDGIEGSSIVDASPGNLNGETSTGFRLQSSLETVSEFRVDSSNYPAEFGTGSAGQISVVTKSGGNQLHGSLFEYLRNDKMDARNFFDGSTKSPLRLNQFGGSIGGPIKKDKLFFFGAVESLRQRAGSTFLATVPSAAARARGVASIQALLAGYPTGTVTSNPDLDLARLNASTATDEYFGNLRLDYHASDKFSMYLRYNRDQGYIRAPMDVSGSYQSITAVPQNAVLGFQNVLSPTMVNEFKIGLNGSKTRISGYAPAIPGIDTSAFAVSFTGSVAIPGIGGQGGSAGAASLGNLIRSNSTQNGRGQPYTGYTLSYIDSLSIVKQNHSIKLGFEYRPIRLYTDRLGGTTYTFSNLNALLANTPSQIQVLGDTSASDPFNGGATGNRFLKQHYLIGYAQDEWKIRRNLTMSYGLRYEFYSVMKEDRNLSVLFNAQTGTIMPNTTPWYKSSKTNFGPRLGFSWSPEKLKNKTVLRVGAGFYYGPGQTEDQVQPIDSDRASRTLTSGIAFPIVPAQVLAGFDPNNLSGYQPRGYSPDYRLPERVLSYTASIQQQLPGEAILTVAYVGSQGRNLFLRSWTNGIIGVNQANGAGILQFGPQFAQIDYKTSGGRDNYNSLQTTLNRRFSKGLTAGFQWTYAHSIGNTGGSNEAQTAQNPFDFSQDHGNNAFDVRHSANLSLLYQLPFKFGNKALNGVVGGWEVGGIWNGRTGLPIDITITRPDIISRVNATGQYVNTFAAGTTTAVINNPYGGAFRNNRRPDVVAGVDPFISTGDRRYFLNPAAFSVPQPGSFGNLGRYALHGPGLEQVDFTLHKRIPLSERQSLEFRAEVYNILNRANFANPPASLANALPSTAIATGNLLQPGQAYTSASSGSAFGVYNSTVSKDVGLGAQRQVQMSLRYSF